MQSFQVPAERHGERLVRVILQQYPQLAGRLVYKALRQKDVRVDGRRVQADLTLQGGEQVQVWLPDDCFVAPAPGAADSAECPLYRVVFADRRLLVVNKTAGLAVHGGGETIAGEPTLIDLVRRQYREPGIELCHRLDRNTGGLVLLARQPAAQAAIRDLMDSGRLLKRYRCLVRGIPDAGHPICAADGFALMQLEAWLEKKSRTSEVYIHAEQQPGDLAVVTRYRVLRTFPGFGPDGEPVSELLVELVTGRTHQIRAHFAFLGHPLLGDGKYGRNQYNHHFRTRPGAGKPGGFLRNQQLFACQLIFLPHGKGPLADLAGRTFAIEPAYDLDLPEELTDNQ